MVQSMDNSARGEIPSLALKLILQAVCAFEVKKAKAQLVIYMCTSECFSTIFKPNGLAGDFVAHISILP